MSFVFSPLQCCWHSGFAKPPGFPPGSADFCFCATALVLWVSEMGGSWEANYLDSRKSKGCYPKPCFSSGVMLALYPSPALLSQCLCEVTWQSYLVRKPQRELIAVEHFLLDGLIWLPNTVINRSSVILQKSKLSFNIRKILRYVMQQNINSQCHTLGKKKLGRNAALAGRIVHIIY